MKKIYVLCKQQCVETWSKYTCINAFKKMANAQKRMIFMTIECKEKNSCGI